MKQFNQSFHQWCFSEEHAFSNEQYGKKSEVSDREFVSLISDEFTYGVDHLIALEGSMLLVGFAKISSVASQESGVTIGELIISSKLEESILVGFIDSHHEIFSKVWVPRREEALVVESFRVYWDNLFTFGGDALMSFLNASSTPSMKFNRLISSFEECASYADIINIILTQPSHRKA